jgi:hypothetical protein
VILKLIKPILVSVSLLSSCFVFAAEGTFLSGDVNFFKINDVDRQAESWASCAAAYDLVATFFPDEPNKAQQYRNFANGAEVAVIMSHVNEATYKDMTPAAFSAMWAYTKTLGDSLSSTRKTSILAEADQADDEVKQNALYKKLGATVNVCTDNLEAQQYYIDAWRDLAKSGMLAVEKQ